MSGRSFSKSADRAMAGIAQKIESYNLAYQLAWRYISEDQKRKQPDIARELHDAIRRLLMEGATEPVFIASEALKDIERASDAANAAA